MAAGTRVGAGGRKPARAGGGYAAPCVESRRGAAGGRGYRTRAVPGGCRPRGAAPGVGAVPMTATPWVAAVAVLGLLLGLALVLLGRGMRQRRGLGAGRTVSLNKVTLTSRRYGLRAWNEIIATTSG